MSFIETKAYLPASDLISSYYLAEETQLVKALMEQTKLTENDRKTITGTAATMTQNIRANQGRLALVDALLQEYGLSTEEGVTLMRLAESLIRTPDAISSIKIGTLISDKVNRHSLILARMVLNLHRYGINRLAALELKI